MVPSFNDMSEEFRAICGGVVEQLRRVGRFLKLSDHVRNNFQRVRLPQGADWQRVECEGSRLIVYGEEKTQTEVDNIFQEQHQPLSQMKVILECDGAIPKFKPLEEANLEKCNLVLDTKDLIHALYEGRRSEQPPFEQLMRCSLTRTQRRLSVTAGIPILTSSVRSLRMYWDDAHGQWKKLYQC